MQVLTPEKPTLQLTNWAVEKQQEVEGLFHRFRLLREQHFEFARRLFLRFKDLLESQMSFEEEVLFPKFEKQVSFIGPTSSLQREHWKLRELLNSMEKRLSHVETRTAKLEENQVENAFQELLFAHHEKEKTLFYPWTDVMLSEEEKTEVLGKAGG